MFVATVSDKRRNSELLTLLHDPAADYFILNLAGALENRQHPRVAPVALRVELHRIARAAMNLHRFTRHALGHFGGKYFRHTRLEIAPLAGILLRGRVIRELARGLE